ncbi:hypothetical protein [Streptomyces sp. NPDC058157]|uniref:hypothetical protein n=1 Tax=Streptomyces sp. NPDC058157 TaxID=3346360 RepID=UPI0036F13600
MLIQSRRGALAQGWWPDLVGAAEAQLPHGLGLDGELLVWDAEEGRLLFEALQRRAAARARGAAGLATQNQRSPEKGAVGTGRCRRGVFSTF